MDRLRTGHYLNDLEIFIRGQTVQLTLVKTSALKNKKVLKGFSPRVDARIFLLKCFKILNYKKNL